MKLTRRKFVQRLAVGATLLSGGIPSIANSVQRSSTDNDLRPNIIFILADDLGWGDLSCYGRPDYQTPNIDLLALQGTKFTDAYSASAVCTPTRCGYITGRYPARFKIGLEEPLVATNSKVGLEPNQQSSASLHSHTTNKQPLPPLQGDVIHETLTGTPGFLYWTGARYAWHAY